MARDAGGSSVGDHIKAAKRQTGKPPPKAPPLPAEATHLWDTFIEVAARRQNSGWGPLPITHQQLESWSRLKAWPLAPWEVDAIMALDSTFMAVDAEAS